MKQGRYCLGLKAGSPHLPSSLQTWKSRLDASCFFFSLCGSIEPHDAPHSNHHAVRILSVGNIEIHSATLAFASEKWKVHPASSSGGGPGSVDPDDAAARDGTRAPLVRPASRYSNSSAL